MKDSFKDLDFKEIPESWNRVELGSLGVFSKGTGISKSDLLEAGLPSGVPPGLQPPSPEGFLPRRSPLYAPYKSYLPINRLKRIIKALSPIVNLQLILDIWIGYNPRSDIKMAVVYPFTAIVGQERMRRALILNAVNPRIGGVLIRGERGTAKSTIKIGRDFLSRVTRSNKPLPKIGRVLAVAE